MNELGKFVDCRVLYRNGLASDGVDGFVGIDLDLSGDGSALAFWLGFYSNDFLNRVYGNSRDAALTMSMNTSINGLFFGSVKRESIRSTSLFLVYCLLAMIFRLLVVPIFYLLKAIRYPIMLIGSLYFIPKTMSFRQIGFWFEELADIVRGLVDSLTYLPRLLIGAAYIESKLKGSISTKMINDSNDETVSSWWYLLSPVLLLSALPQIVLSPLHVLALLFYNHRAVPRFLLQTLHLLFSVVCGPFQVLFNIHPLSYNNDFGPPPYADRPPPYAPSAEDAGNLEDRAEPTARIFAI
ncbi:hypothetical protein MMH89_00235 [Candidatus Comchoanobacter bicostacola]|uniref:Uncharacterized protein n=1 Tax=Candidatus Comchoanobacter bicostacola TaxID=2919598 RepID=A0ABY5DL44_9GAMM|nr:hypothetical protein [Candidatus Comchoanobacter bicostacola]UTC24594.1 hypothetical protein MMH89_00235 [Candidatus Comchoanobacter bicostacola]